METVIDLPDVFDADCPTRRVLDVIGDKWATLIILLLEDGPKRFSQIQRSIHGISHKVLSQTLRGLERDGIVTRTVYPVVPPRVEYTLTPLGETLLGPIMSIVQWTYDHVDEVNTAQVVYDLRTA